MWSTAPGRSCGCPLCWTGYESKQDEELPEQEMEMTLHMNPNINSLTYTITLSSNFPHNAKCPCNGEGLQLMLLHVYGQRSILKNEPCSEIVFS